MKFFVIILFFLAFFVESTNAQFYNGHQMSFGKNRVQYKEYLWYYYRYQRFDTYYYPEGKDIALYAADKIETYLPQIESFFGYTLQKRIIFLVYNRLGDFRQSNIGLKTEDIESNVGGTTKIIDNKVFLYFESDHKKFDIQIKEAIAEIVLNEMLFGGKLREKVANSTLISVPDWYQKGLVAFAANEWNSEIENTIKDGITKKKYRKFNQLRGDDAKYAGYSIWYYISQIFGADAIPSIIYLTRINKNPDSGFLQVVGSSVKELTPDWKAWYLEKFANTNIQTPVPDSVKIVKRPKKSIKYLRPEITNNGKFLSYITNFNGRYKVWIYNTETKKRKVIFKRGEAVEQINDYTFPVMAWHPTGKLLSFTFEEKGFLYLMQYNTETKELKKRQLPYFEQIYDFSYADNGMVLVMSAQVKGLVDIFVFNITSGTFERITNDLADDINPQFIDNGQRIIFSSNRLSDTLVTYTSGVINDVSQFYNLFIYNYKQKVPVLKRVTDTKYTNEYLPSEQSVNSYMYTSDDNGIINLHMASTDSTISYIDTITHYRYFSTAYPVTNFDRNMDYYQYSKLKKQISSTFLYADRHPVYLIPNMPAKNSYKGTYKNTFFRNRLLHQYKRTDSLLVLKKIRAQKEQDRMDSLIANPPKNMQHPDSVRIDINNYLFEMDKNPAYQHFFYGKLVTNPKQQTDSVVAPRQKLYLTNFYTDYLVNQVDFGTLSESYQVYTGGPFYFNPGMNVFFKLGVNDLFEDYRVIGAMRVAGNLDSYEYLFSFENLRHRFDKQFVYHRQSFVNNSDQFLTKIITNEVKYIFKFPFNQISALKGTASLRYDKGFYLSTDYGFLQSKPEYQAFSGAKLEYIFDNSVELGLNLYHGIRAKAWAEVYQQVEGNYDMVNILGADLRIYQKIHRNLIFASRVAGSTSFGTGKLIYYLGGVDNWTTFSPTKQIFDASVDIDQDANYIYQAVATNMRGFLQNVRNGSSFITINNEIRWPIFRYFANRPINSDFFNNFQIVGFFDAGSAWSGLTPWSSINAYNKYTIENGPITVIIDIDRPSFVAGYGYGLRTRLFGYFMRFDWAWGIEGNVILPRIFYFSLNLDF